MNNVNQSKSVVYEICIKGLLEDDWSDWFDGMTLTTNPESGVTVLTGIIVDQAELYGLLNKIRDLGMPLLTLKQIKHNQDN